MPTSPADSYQDIREAVRALSVKCLDDYHRRIDAARGYPKACVTALTEAGYSPR